MNNLVILEHSVTSIDDWSEIEIASYITKHPQFPSIFFSSLWKRKMLDRLCIDRLDSGFRSYQNCLRLSATVVAGGCIGCWVDLVDGFDRCRWKTHGL